MPYHVAPSSVTDPPMYIQCSSRNFQIGMGGKIEGGAGFSMGIGTTLKGAFFQASLFSL